ncbi:hypothetical protein CONPUDRAFT_83176 [Coniophora puteana RWD-64-598 SS2]|uniref:Uncharacterized protein n=1 Tax=Coniophora puteana (strain RWD-64-598) TaxID=741705 RepID=A0A5M3MLK1_CONPW|nr:uncharacterized protein CONPUDRAFT_83176 [Coniophora puteana RWD-64-598 SS2]EIW79973.1 hypothetical protein CONPUDRAFT_83176 [Coniophora puteana RWD-64-598 SS2]
MPLSGQWQRFPAMDGACNKVLEVGAGDWPLSTRDVPDSHVSRLVCKKHAIGKMFAQTCGQSSYSTPTPATTSFRVIVPERVSNY